MSSYNSFFWNSYGTQLKVFPYVYSEVFPYVTDEVPNHDERKSKEQSQSSSDLGKEGLERVDQNLFVNFHTSCGEGKSKPWEV